MTDIAWFESTSGELPRLFQKPFIDYLTHTPHRVDILLSADGMTTAAQADLFEQLAHHPNVGTLIFCKVPGTQRPLIVAQAALFNLHIRFCDTEEELRVLLNKRRSRALGPLS